jgi:hypothetical protein
VLDSKLGVCLGLALGARFFEVLHHLRHGGTEKREGRVAFLVAVCGRYSVRSKVFECLRNL